MKGTFLVLEMQRLYLLLLLMLQLRDGKSSLFHFQCLQKLLSLLVYIPLFLLPINSNHINKICCRSTTPPSPTRSTSATNAYFAYVACEYDTATVPLFSYPHLPCPQPQIPSHGMPSSIPSSMPASMCMPSSGASSQPLPMPPVGMQVTQLIRLFHLCNSLIHRSQVACAT